MLTSNFVPIRSSLHGIGFKPINNFRKSLQLNMQIEPKNGEEKQKLAAEKVFFEGPPSKVELIIPFFLF